MIARALAAFLALAAALAVPVQAERQPQTAVEAAVSDAVPGHPGLTYAALLKLALPDLPRAKTGSGPARLPGRCARRTASRGRRTLTFRSVETLEILSDGRPIRPGDDERHAGRRLHDAACGLRS